MPKDSMQIQKLGIKNIDIQLEILNSFINNGNTPIVIKGLNFGFNEFIKATRIGLGFYYVHVADAEKANFVNATSKLQELVPQATILNYEKKKVYLAYDDILVYYLMPNFQVRILGSKWLNIALNTGVGIGYAYKKRLDYFTNTEIPIVSKNKVLANSNTFLPCTIGGVINFNLSNNVKLNSLGGYRFILETIGISENYDGWYYQLGLKIEIFGVAKEMHNDWRVWQQKRKIKKQ